MNFNQDLSARDAMWMLQDLSALVIDYFDGPTVKDDPNQFMLILRIQAIARAAVTRFPREDEGRHSSDALS